MAVHAARSVRRLSGRLLQHPWGLEVTARSPMTSRGLALTWAGAVVVVGAVAGGAAWATRTDGKIGNNTDAIRSLSDDVKKDREEMKAEVKAINANLVRLMIRLGIDPVEERK